MRKEIKIAAHNSFWTASSQLIDKALKFLTVPILINYFGRLDYGMLAVLAGITGYSQIVALGIPTGVVKHVAEWLQKNDHKKISLSARSTLTFYIMVGIANAVIFLFIAIWGIDWFALMPEQKEIFRNMLFVACVFSLIHWSTIIFSQLLSAAEDIAFMMKLGSLSSIFDLMLVLATVFFKLDFFTFFYLRLFIPLYQIPFLAWCWKRHGNLKDVSIPGWYWREFRPVFFYGLNLLSIGIFQIAFNQLRPVILGMRAQNMGDVTDYTIVSSIAMIVMLSQGWLLGPLIPMMSKAIARNDHQLLNTVLYKVTKYYWIFVAFVIIVLIINSENIILIYVGSDYNYLSFWLVVHLLAFAPNYVAPFSSYVLAMGRLREFMFFTAFSSCSSLVLTWLFAPVIGFRSAIIATNVYYILQMLFYHIFYMPKVMKIQPLVVLRKCYIPVTMVAVILILLIEVVKPFITLNNIIFDLIKNCLIALLAYSFIIYIIILNSEEKDWIKKVLIVRRK